ncbi:hypothetical protein Gotri_005288, partial [Gossypium trilobum]|nr:hypothetical protein [Gossypium trilobum]
MQCLTPSVEAVYSVGQYNYGFRTTVESALVEIVIFMSVSLQSNMFSSSEFDYLSQYLGSEQNSV